MPDAHADVLVVGASVAGVRTAQALRAEGFTGTVTVAGAEDTVPYDKPPLSKEILVGTRTAEQIALLGDGEAGRLGLTLRLGVRAVALDPAHRTVRLADGTALGYGALVIATGARARTLPAPQDRLVHTVRDLADARGLAERLASGAPVAVIGGGFVGAEVASAAVAHGCEVTLVEAAPAPFAQVLGERTGALLGGLHRRNGVRVIAGAKATAVRARADGSRLLTLSDGRRLTAATVVAGIGCVPNTAWLEGSGITLDDGVVTDEFCAVPGAAGVHAIGDVARTYDPRTGRHHRVEHWTNAAEQAGLVARNLVHPDARRPYAPVPYFWSDQHGVKVQMVGRAAPGDEVELLRCTTPGGERDAALYARDGRLTAAVTFGWPRGCTAARRLLAQGQATPSGLRERLTALSTAVAPVPTPA